MRVFHSLVLQSAVSVVPILVFALLAAGFVVQGERDNLVSTAKARNRATLAAVDAELRVAIGTLHAISSTPSLAAGQLEEFHRYAHTVLASQASWQNIVLNDPRGVMSRAKTAKLNQLSLHLHPGRAGAAADAASLPDR